MRQLVIPSRRLQEIAPVKDGLFRAKLAEDYDGIGQYILVALAGSAVGSAYKARIASGDFGGARTFPAGTPVTVHSYRGTLEVFLGNKPGDCEDAFNRDVTLGLGESQFGPDWQYADYSHVEAGTIFANGTEAVFDVKFRALDGGFGEAERLAWVSSSEAFTLPYKVRWSFRHDQSPWPPLSVAHHPFLAGIIAYRTQLPTPSASCEWQISINDIAGQLELFASEGMRSGTGNQFVEYQRPYQNDMTYLVEMLITDSDDLDTSGRFGTYVKIWSIEEEEPEDYQASDTYLTKTSDGWTGAFTPDTIGYYSEDLSSSIDYAFTYWDFLKVLEGTCPVL